MTAHEGFTNRVADDAFIFRTGALAAGHVDAYVRHLEKCRICADELDRIDRVFSGLGAVFEAEPHHRLRRRVLDRFAIERAAAQVSLPAETVRSEAVDWEESGIPGVRIKRLFVDSKKRRMAALLVMDAGATFPPHRHKDVEEFILLDGDLSVDEETVMKVGDYLRAESGSRHGPQSTKNGCLLFLSASIDDVDEETFGN